MRKIRSYIVWITVLALMLALMGCDQNEPDPTTVPTTAPTTVPTTVPTEPPLTVDDVYESVGAAMANAEASRLRMALSYEMSVTEGEGDTATTTEIVFDMIMDTMVSTDPFGSYTLMDMAVDTTGYSMGYTIEAYIVEEDNSVVTYLQMFDAWTRSDYGMSTKEFIASGQMTEVSTEEIWSSETMPADMTLDEDTQTLNDTEVYVLRGTIPAGDMSEAFTNLGIEDPAELEDLTLPVVYYVDAQSFMILRMEANMAFLVDILDNAIAESMIGTDAEGAQIELNIPALVYDLEYGVPEIPAVPQEAYDYIEQNAGSGASGDILDTEPVYDGPLVLNCGDEQLLITCPEGWSGEVYDENNIWIYNEDYSLYGDFYYFTGWTEDEFMEQIQQDAAALKDADIFISMGEGPSYDGYKTTTVMGDGESYCYAWTPMGEGYLLVIFADYTETPDFDTLVPLLLDLVAPYTE